MLALLLAVATAHAAPSLSDLSWLVGAWQGTPTNVAPDEHDEIRWFSAEELLTFAHEQLGPTLLDAIRGAPA